ncbi:MAG: hypothetical protein CEN88_305 [Candidatus Berkelbacteria bacterium Licking1014_2]|uniref:RNA-binding protein KhpA n=1 Tax=Candidatus Berkelbacteria bacterium Licking1014_2 TaxID=2017146 RepID=A0A554LUU4_9BACT|nr:MAG: hypothetical protein CEN88_305 [Candidatus Berkelbacteria bacterium Licking1014_2]
MPQQEQDAKFVEDVVKQLVDNPDDVKVERKIDEMGVLITLTVNPQDMGTIIGKEGRTAKSLRTLLRVLGAKKNARVNLKITEPEGSTRPAPAEEPKKSEEPVEEDKSEDIKPLEEETPTEIV